MLEHREGAGLGVAVDGDSDNPEIVQEGGEHLVDLVPIVARETELANGWGAVGQLRYSPKMLTQS